MLDLMLSAFLAGSGVAVIAGPLGCFVVWRRMAYFGDTMAHASLLGVALGLLLGVAPLFGVIAVGGAIALAMARLKRADRVADDTVLGILSHGALAVGLVALSLMPQARTDLTGALFGDVLAVSREQMIGGWIGALLLLAVLVRLWPVMLAATVHEELARVEGRPVDRASLVFMLLVALTVAWAMKIVGALMVTAMLIVPAAAARRFARTPEGMAVFAALIGVLAVGFGLIGAFLADTPAGPSIVVAALALFLLSQVVRV